MKYSILGFSQEYAIKLQREQDGKVKKLDTIDLLILRNIADFMNRSKIIKYTIDDKVYFSIQYATILEDLPILDIKKQALSDRLDKMVFLGVLEKIVVKNQCGTFIAFRMGVEYENLLYYCTNSQAIPTSSELQVQTYSTTTHNTNTTNNSSTNKEIEDKSSTKKEVDEFIERMYLSYPTHCPKRNTSLGKTKKDKERIKKLLKCYSMKEIESVFNREIEEKYNKQYMQNFSTFLNNFPDPNVFVDSLFNDASELSKVEQLNFGGVIYR